jgi:hypothetical protein
MSNPQVYSFELQTAQLNKEQSGLGELPGKRQTLEVVGYFAEYSVNSLPA